MRKINNKKQIAVILEGVGGSGKTKQASLVAESLREMGQDVCVIKLPCYNTPTGVLIKKIIYEDYPFFPPEGNSMQKLFSLNRDEVLHWIQQVRNNGYSLVLDRWISSNAVSIVTKRLKSDSLKSLEAEFSWAKGLDKEFLSLFNDITLAKIFLDVDPKKAKQSRELRNQPHLAHDIFEKEGAGIDRSDLLRKYIEWEGDWNIVRRGERSENETSKKCMEVVQKAGGVDMEVLANLWVKGAPKKGKLIHFDEILERTFSSELLDGIGKSLDEARDRQNELQNSLVWTPREHSLYPEKDWLAIRSRVTPSSSERIPS